mgnify:CR=1 FL=1
MTQTIVITGAAGAGASGIGGALTEYFHDKGFQLIGFDQAAPVGRIAEIFAQDQHRYFQCDLTQAHEIQAIAQDLQAQDTIIHHMILNAGGGVPAEFSTDFIDVETWDMSIQRNLSASYYAIISLLPLMRTAQADKSILLMSSINAIQGYGLVGYSAAKAGLIGLMHALTAPLGAEAIRINALLPGTVKPALREDKDYQKLSAESALKKMAHPQDVAEAAAHILAMPHMTGAQIVLDGGQSLYRRQK